MNLITENWGHRNMKWDAGADLGVADRAAFFLYINKLYFHTVLKVFSQDEVFRPTLSLIPGSAPGMYM
jgi:hypothetical protein